MSAESLSNVVGRILHPGPTREGEPLAETGRAGRNLPAAITTGVILVTALTLSLAFAHDLFSVVIAVLCMGAIWELGGAFARLGITIAAAPLYVGAVGILTCAWLLGAEALLFALYITVFAVITWRILEQRSASRIYDVVASIFVAVYVPFAASFFLLLLRDTGNPWAVGAVVAMVVASDTGGWAVGVLIGRHPMIPRISPKKSWEGFAGSVVAAIGVGVTFFALSQAHWAWGIAAGVAAAFIGTIGDLTESLIKREAGLKDMSRLLPGHGGVLDRVDSLLMSAPVLYVIISAAFGTGQ
ncbi:phosphatidate cytidylyltransferase [Schaalia sp. ZJ1691]|uniref:phosphatidate cytidylyltransferase n=1 Tax=Schaalia sp. ZJ1691 TaxID=2709404 RepID=UPI0013EA90B0|nr:phosphatidate cytidylyltransferase [Schaalia sp. ZJ1691]